VLRLFLAPCIYALLRQLQLFILASASECNAELNRARNAHRTQRSGVVFQRFGCALELWHKGELHLPKDEPEEAPIAQEVKEREAITDSRLAGAIVKIKSGEFTLEKLHRNFLLNEYQLKILEEAIPQ